MLQCNKFQGGAPSQTVSRIGRCRAIAIFAAVAMLAGCESVPDVVNPMTWFGNDEPPPPAQTAKPDEKFPAIGSVPERPPAPSLEQQQAQIREGLVADQENARYTDAEVKQEVARRTAAVPGALGPRANAAPSVPSAPSTSVPSVPPAPRASVPPPAVPTAPPVPPRVASASAPRPSVPPAPAPSVPAAVPQASSVPVTVPPPPPPVAPEPPARVEMPAPPSVAPTPPPIPVAQQVQQQPSAPVAPPAAATAAPALAEPVKVATIYFEDGSKSLRPGDVAILEQIAAAQRSSGKRLRVSGHASGRAQTFDAVRREKVNFQMSLARANSVAAALVSLGVPSSEIVVQALGDSAPLYAEFTPTGEAANRRAEVWMFN
jgi:outer membrane protein OmpA-like peptidoglycan-associated protein